MIVENIKHSEENLHALKKYFHAHNVCSSSGRLLMEIVVDDMI